MWPEVLQSQYTRGTPPPSASLSNACSYGGLHVHKSYPRLIRGPMILDQIWTHF